MLILSILSCTGGFDADHWNLRPRRLCQPAAAASPPPRRCAVRREPALHCRCPRWNGRPRSSARPRISTSACKHVIPPVEWPFFAPYVKAINELKQAAQRRHPRAQLPDAGDLPLRRRFRRRLAAARASRRPRSKADIIVQCGVHFMAETSKILNPDKTVLIPDLRAGCSLASSITGADVRLLREHFPGVPVVTYVNTSADVKAESRHLLHLVERGAGGREPRRRHGDLPARPVSREICRLADQGEDHRLEGRLRGA